MLTVKFLTHLVSCGIFFSILLLVSITISKEVKIIRVFCYAAYFGLGGLILGQNEIITFTMFTIGVVWGLLSSSELSDEKILEKLKKDLKQKGPYKLEEFSTIIGKTPLSLKSKKVILAQIKEEMKSAVWFRKHEQDLLVYHIFTEYPAEYQKCPRTTFLTAIGLK